MLLLRVMHGHIVRTCQQVLQHTATEHGRSSPHGHRLGVCTSIIPATDMIDQQLHPAIRLPSVITCHHMPAMNLTRALRVSHGMTDMGFVLAGALHYALVLQYYVLCRHRHQCPTSHLSPCRHTLTPSSTTRGDATKACTPCWPQGEVMHTTAFCRPHMAMP